MQVTKREAIETRESQLWWLAVTVIVLMALALFVIDMANMTGRWRFSPQIEFALNTRVLRAGLILATLLICAYFRDSARRLRHENNELIRDLAHYGEQLERKNREISRLKDLSDRLIGMTDLRDALDLILGMAVEVIGADSASIMLREKDNDTFRILSSHGLPPGVVESTRVRMGEAIAGLVARDRKPLVLNSDELEGEIARRALRKESIVSSVVVPIQLGDEVRGVLSIAKRRGGACFTEEDLGVLSTLANQASLVIQKIELLDDLRNQVGALAATVQELREAQAEVMQSEKLASIGQLTGGVAHGIADPLQVILGRAELLLSQENNEIKLVDLKSILEHTTRIVDTVSILLSFSRPAADVEFQDVDVNAVVSKTLGLLEPQMTPDDVVVVRELEENLTPIPGSASQLQQVFTNIALNAYQAMRGGGGTLTVRSRSKLEALEIEFADNGPGIPQEYVGRIFEPFFTTKPEDEGTGLGLSVAHSIVKSHGGSIQVRSNPGEGACFTISLPIKQDWKSQEGEAA